jgi:hypothetical protein
MSDELGANYPGGDDGNQASCSEGKDLPPAPFSRLVR